MIYVYIFIAWLILMFFFSVAIGLTLVEFVCEYPVAWFIAFLTFAMMMLRNSGG